jgi:hypothetical protein
MTDFYIRTEDIKDENVLDLFVETSLDRQIISALKGRNPTVLLGSRGVGKSFLLRVAQAELFRDFNADKVFPVYVSFTKSSLIQTNAPEAFQYWMLARICSAITRGLAKRGLLVPAPAALSVISGGALPDVFAKTVVEEIAEQFESAWKSPSAAIDTKVLPTADDLKDALDDVCRELGISRIALFIDEAAHIFLPEQQRQFFTLFRDLRSPFLTCNAAVYPGVTSYGSTFQLVHDATVLSVDRDITDSDYVKNMREIVERQADSTLIRNIQTNGQNFASLAYAATGNPRILLKTLARAPKLNSSQLNEVLREYYRTDVWSEHSQLAEKYVGHRSLIDWGRKFIESTVLPELKNKNDGYLRSDKKTSCFFWLHRDVPKAVEQALRILAYTGIVIEHAQGIKATRSEIGTRYLVNLGCLFAQEGQAPATTAFQVSTNLTFKRMSEYGANHEAFKTLLNVTASLDDSTVSHAALLLQLEKNISVLDLTEWQRSKLIELGYTTVGAVLNATETDLKQALYVGDVRSRRMRNAAVASVFEYLSG